MFMQQLSNVLNSQEEEEIKNSTSTMPFTRHCFVLCCYEQVEDWSHQQMMVYHHHLRVHSSLRNNEWSAVYANVVKDSSDALISNRIEILFAWLNLDLGVEACLSPFYLGML